MATASMEEVRIEIRLPASLKGEIEQAAALHHQTVEAFATFVLAEAARKVLEAGTADHRYVTLSERDAKRFLEMLDADPTPNAALLAAAKHYRENVAHPAGNK